MDSEAAGTRRKRGGRGDARHPFGVLDREAVRAVAQLGCCTVPQLAGFLGWTERKASNHLRNAYDWEYLDKRAVTRSQLAAAPDPANVYGSAPDVYVLEAKGRREARELLSEEEVSDTPEIHDKSFLVAHHLLIRDVRVWLARVSRAYPQHPGLLEWRGERQARAGNARPDGWFRFGLEAVTFGDFVEADRGTMTSPSRWEEKVAQYASLLAQEGDGSPVKDATGLDKCRVLAVAPTPERRDWIWKVVSDAAPRHGIRPGRILVAESYVMGFTDPSVPAWRANGRDEPVPLVQARFL